MVVTTNGEELIRYDAGGRVSDVQDPNGAFFENATECFHSNSGTTEVSLPNEKFPFTKLMTKIGDFGRSVFLPVGWTVSGT